MEEDISIINNNTRSEKIKNFFVKNKNKLIIFFLTIILLIFGFFALKEYENSKKEKIAEEYNQASIKYFLGDKTKSKNELIEIIKYKDSTYSPLALYFLIDNQIDISKEETNQYFDVLIQEVKLDKEIRNLIIYKKGLFNSDFETENNLMAILKPVINSESIWKSHALYLMGEYFIYKNQKQKAKEFFDKIIALEDSNMDIKLQTQKRLRQDFSE
tara:strand:+ start:615 stop:1259 length:645 start_codon:yes stop_codon:yes gene_type:complete